MGTSQSRNRLIGGTDLVEAAGRGDIDLVRQLLAEGADVNVQNNNGNTALMNAAFRGYADIVRLLLASPRIDVNPQNNGGKTALIYAAAVGHTDVVRLLLASPRIDVSATDNGGQTALMWAERRGHTDVVRAINSFLAGQEINRRWIPRHRSRQRDRFGLSELDREGRPFMDLVYYHTQGFL